MKIPEVWSLENFLVGEHILTREVIHLNSIVIEALVLETLPGLAICIFSSGFTSVFFFIISFNKMVNVKLNVFLSLVNYFSKLVEPKEGVMRTSSL